MVVIRVYDEKQILRKGTFLFLKLLITDNFWNIFQTEIISP